MGATRRTGDPLVHLAFVLGKFSVELASKITSIFSLDETQSLKVTPLKVPRETVYRRLVRCVEFRAIARADFRPCRTARERRLDDLVQVAFNRGVLAVVVIVVKAFLITDPVDRLAVGDDDVSMALKHPDLVMVVRTGEAPQIE